ncbi:PREDICTED: 21 kDa protein-like [Ipomoea nil]|uniref:21 kDa protein-like n=1 Tax=Ipomoea nil TaxID=35883 RepID=UPI000901C53A|nr:PREDICTED: 21 kDa protein-like [Ipomoea nil]
MCKAKMGNLSLLYLVLIILSSYLAGTAESSSFPSNFIKASCRATRYPSLCVDCLSAYANSIQQSERQLAEVALSVSLAKARSAAMFVVKLTRSGRGLKPRELQAVKDCVDTMGDTMDELRRSIRELGRAAGRVPSQDFVWHVGNVQTWVSAALTNENTCLDGFAGAAMDGNVKGAIRARVLNVARVTSNALALVNRFAARHRPGGGAATHNGVNVP